MQPAETPTDCPALHEIRVECALDPSWSESPKRMALEPSGQEGVASRDGNSYVARVAASEARGRTGKPPIDTDRRGLHVLRF